MPILFAIFLWLLSGSTWAATPSFPRPLESYADASGSTLGEILHARIVAEPFNLVATLLFLGAIIHTFLAPKFTRISHRWAELHQEKIIAQGRTGEAKPQPDARDDVSFRVQIMHFLGEVEAIFGIWVIPLVVAIAIYKGWPVAEHYLSSGVNFTEPIFVVIIMAISATRPVLRFARQCLSLVASLGKRSPAAWWLAILTLGPLLGSCITEPAAMTISALLLAEKFYELQPGNRFRYATLGLLFVNISVGGTLTHFAAPPVLMVATKWHWDTVFMLTHFGWKALIGILLSNLLYFLVFRREFSRLQPLAKKPDAATAWSDRTDAIPLWVTLTHLLFLGWTVYSAHYPALFVGGFLFFLAFTTATEHHQNPIRLQPSLLVGFFLAGLVVHGGLQGWWISPVLSRLGETPFLLGATALTAFNDNAAITYLATLVPNFSTALQYAVVAGAVAGGGLTVIANAPNPAGQSILSAYFKDGISPLGLLLGALPPTAIMLACFLFLK